MDTTSDDLTRPLGTKRAGAKPRAAILRRALPIAGLAAGGLVGAVLVYGSLFGDPRGGLPHERVEIVERARRPEPAAAPAPGPGANPSARQDATAVERASGVSVTRPPGTAPPEALIVRVPDDVTVSLAPAPDPRLVDRTRAGALPRIGQDGSKPLDVYARPVTGLSDGESPAGRIALVVGGLGISAAGTRDAIARLPPAVTLAFAPYGQDLDGMAARARAAGHEIMLQVPMEPFDYPDSDPGPHTLTAASRPAENIEHLHWAMGRFPGYVGVVNYMGGKLTADEKALSPILREIGARGLAFLDDGSSARSVAAGFKGETPVRRAEIVVDIAGRADAIDKALERLEATARAGGTAIGTATALPLSLDRIERWAKGLEARGILLVPASAAFRAERRDASPR